MEQQFNGKQGVNKKDPLLDTPEVRLAIYEILRDACNGYPHEAVTNAAANLIMNSIRQQNKNWRQAEVAFDELFGRCKQALKNHFDGATGDRRNIFPYKQTLRVTEPVRLNPKMGRDIQ